VGGVGKQVRCSGCQGAFCTMYVSPLSTISSHLEDERKGADDRHRSQESHECTAPFQTNARQDAFLERRAKAKEIIAQKFPETRTRDIPKLPPQRDVIKQRPKSPDRLPPSLQIEPPAKPQIDTAKSKPKSKAEKMYEIELRKLRSLAKPLDQKMQATGERRFFQWGLGVSEDIKKWKGGGKIDKKWEKVWVPVVSPILLGDWDGTDGRLHP
jgi:hypothetical protein